MMCKTMNLISLLLSLPLCYVDFINCSEVPCNLQFGIDITDGIIFENGSVLKDDVMYTKENYMNEHNGLKIGCICNIKVCMRKCCPIGEYLTNKTCQTTRVPFIIPEDRGPTLESFHIVSGNECNPKLRRSLLDPRNHNVLGQFVLQPDGRLLLPPSMEYYNQIDYCLDYIDEVDEIKALICSRKNANVVATNVIGMLISMPFLLATFIVYALLPERNLHGKSLMCYVITLFGAYFLLVFNYYYPYDLEDAVCITVGVVGYFLFMVSFFLMNVMSIDMWWTFSGCRGFSGTRKQTEQKRLTLYSVYAWGVPFIFAVIVTYFTLNLNVPLDAWYNPGIANGQCWFLDGVPRLVYFYGPITVLLIANTILFIITAYKIKKVQKDTAVLRRDDNQKHNYDNDKQSYNLYLKLMLAMGVNWSMEIISWVVNWQIVHVPSVWYFTDFLNALYGVFIFLIFTFKKAIWKHIQNRCLRCCKTIKESEPERSVTMVEYAPKGAGGNVPAKDTNGSTTTSQYT